MGRILTAIGVLLVLVFAGAASAPFLIDWNKQKPLFEAEAARVLGLPVLVDGRMEFQIFPSPVLRIESVRIGQRGAEARIGAVDLELSVGGLVRGHIDVVQARLVDPKVWIGLDREGRLTGLGPHVDLSTVSLRRLEVEGGELTIEDPREGTRFFASQLAFGGEATSLAGPWRLDGTGRFEGQRAAFSVQTGRADDQGLRVRLQVEPSERPVATEFDGQLSVAERRPLLTGVLRLRGVGAVDAAAREGGWRGEAHVEIRPERLVATAIKVVPAQANERVLEFSGTVNAVLGPSGRLDAALGLRQLDLDRLTGVASGDTQVDVPAILRRVAQLPALLALPASDGRVSLDVGSVVLAGGLLQNARLQLDMNDGRLRLTLVEAVLPGQASLRASGQMGLRGAPLFFEGPVELNVRAPGTFASWLEGELLRPRDTRVPPPPGGIVVSGRLTVGAERVALTGLSASAGGAALNGEIDYVPALSPARLRVRLATADLDVEPLAALVGAFAPRLAGLDVGEIDATLRAARLRYRSVDARGVDVSLRSGVEGLVVESLSGALNGLALSGAGRIDPDRSGAIRLRLAGDRIGPAVDALREAVGGHPLLDALSTRAAALGAVALDATLTRQGDTLEIALGGTAATTRVEAGATVEWPSPGAEALRRLNVSLQAPRTEALLAQLGLAAMPTPSDRPARLTTTLERAASGPHRLSLDGDLAGSRVAAVGPAQLVSGVLVSEGLAVAVSSADLAPLLVSIGHPVVEAVDRVPVSARGRLILNPADVRLTGIDGTVGGETVRGEMALTREVVPRLSGQLTVGGLAIERVAALVAGPWPDADGEGWSRTAFGPRPLPPMVGTVAIETPRLDIDRLSVTDARFTLRVGEGGLGVEGLTGRLAGGRLLGELIVSRPEAGVRVSARATLEGARLEDLVWRDGGRPVATGRADLRLTVEGTGRTPSVLVSSLMGEGTLALSRGELRSVTNAGFAAGLRASEAGLDLDEARLQELVRREMSAGLLPFQRLDAAFAIQSGVIRATNLTLDGGPMAVTGRATVDLPRWTIDADWTLEGDPPRPGLRGPRIGMTFTGPIDRPERRIDVRAFVDQLNLRRFEREVERLEAIQRQIDERERILREMEQQEELRRERALRDLERRAREVPPQTPPSAPAEAPPAPAPSQPAAPGPARVSPPASPTAEERARFNAIIQDSLRALPPAATQSPAPAAPESPRPGLTLDPLPPPVVVPSAPGSGRAAAPQPGPVPR